MITLRVRKEDLRSEIMLKFFISISKEGTNSRDMFHMLQEGKLCKAISREEEGKQTIIIVCGECKSCNE